MHPISWTLSGHRNCAATTAASCFAEMHGDELSRRGVAATGQATLDSPTEKGTPCTTVRTWSKANNASRRVYLPGERKWIF